MHPTILFQVFTCTGIISGAQAKRLSRSFNSRAPCFSRPSAETSGYSFLLDKIENGTRINLHFGDAVLPGILNDSDTAKALIDMLPYTVHMNSYSHDFCGVMPDALPYNEDEVHYGWLNGDIDYAIDAPYFTILHSDEDISERYGYQVNIGVLDCELSQIRELSGSYDVLIELAD